MEIMLIGLLKNCLEVEISSTLAQIFDLDGLPLTIVQESIQVLSSAVKFSAQLLHSIDLVM